ncbi:probable diphthine methyl ester synthase [Macadamia integrifolia]|uniref:probable diphthine methyl ester synthase n=1 Tax=Macadamia integrifolia TaxID=60698 RepID=UPI001C4F95A7|nr:probable diphthine methyl ester synthase [Macadamia integrifolia]
MLYIIGLGLGDERDITLRGLEAVRKCDKVYMEAYTSLLSFGLSSDGLSTLEELYGRPIILADREKVEEQADDMLAESGGSNVAFLVVGDPFGATTHSDLVVRAKKLGVEVKVIHNASVMNAIGVCGLQLYRYGETVSIPFFTETWRPDSFYEKIQRNRVLGLHTLCLLGTYLYYFSASSYYCLRVLLI